MLLMTCVGCGKHPNELHEFSPESTGEDMPNEVYAWNNEGTLNTTNGHFLCMDCYIREGMPSSPSGWVAP